MTDENRPKPGFSETQPEELVVPRSSGIGCYPPAEPGTTDLSEPGMFASNDGKVLNWNGANYYRACGALVSRNLDGDSSCCVKREGHPGDIHEDYDGRTRDALDLQLGVMSLSEAVGVSLGAASSCWSNLTRAGTFQSKRCEDIAKQLLERIRQAGPIYD
jgi:hypothetical protein